MDDIILREASRFRDYHNHRVKCPFCGPARKPQHAYERTLSVKRDGDRVVYLCHHCEAKGSISVEVAAATRPQNPLSVSELSDAALEYLKTRKISAATAKRLGLFETSRWIAGNNNSSCIGFPYKDEGKMSAAKLREYPDKKFSQWGVCGSFFNIEAFTIGENLLITEGEYDTAAFEEAGIKAMSVPNGAPMKISQRRIDPEEDFKFKYVWTANKHLNAAARVLIAADADDKGEALGEELARRIGKAKCWRVVYPEGCKDANDVLINHGPEALHAAIGGAIPWPVSGLYGAEEFEAAVFDAYENGMASGVSTGYAGVDNLYTIAPGELTVVTGLPSDGKSEFVDQLMVNVAETQNWTFAICSFENQPQQHIAKLVSKRMRQPFWDGPIPRMSREDAKVGFEWVGDHFVFLHQDDGSMTDLDSILDRLKAAVMRLGIRGAVIDPYNYIERPRDMSETDWISLMLTKVRLFAKSHDVHIWFVAHPTKMMKGAGGKVPVPTGNDISGSMAWFAKTDCGISVYRTDEVAIGCVEIHIWKVRFQWIGKRGIAELYYDPPTTRYSDPNNAPHSIIFTDEDENF